MKFNLSYSALSTYKKSPLQFYFQYIRKAAKTDEVKQVYGDAGTVVHYAMEDYIADRSDTFYQHWEEFSIDKQTGFNNIKLSSLNYRKMYINAVNYIKPFLEQQGDDFQIKTEHKFEKEFFQNIKIKGFIDVFITHEPSDELICSDWKTNSQHSYETHKDQRLMYSYYCWKHFGEIPQCEWVYLKQNVIVKDKFTITQLEDFEKECQTIINQIQMRGNIVSQYDAGEWKNPFNAYGQLCQEEVERRANKSNIVLRIKGAYVFIEGIIDERFFKGLDNNTKFDLPDKFFMQKAVQKSGRGYIADVGTVHLFNNKFKCFPIGLLNKAIKICNDYIDYFKVDKKVIIIDERNPNNIEMLKKNNYSVNTLRQYQKDAVQKFIENKIGILHMATGSGKTFTACELIDNINTRTLWICDRAELLTQTKKAIEEYTDKKVGVIKGKIVELDKQITIATIQSLYSKLSELRGYLKTINFIIVDEFHKGAAETFQKVLGCIPARNRLGLTATPKRDDGKTPIIHGLMGDVIYKIDAAELIAQGYLMKPNIVFYNVPGSLDPNMNYPEDYKVNIVENEKRNKQIIISATISQEEGEKILILTKKVEHGTYLCGEIPGSTHIHGSLKTLQREIVFEDFKNCEAGVLIMTTSIGAEGLDIPDLDVIINAGGNKGDVKSIQVLGRVLRKASKKKSATYIDFIDEGPYTRKHSKKRIEAFKDEGHEVQII